MINLRYHIVSLVAVFLALGLGVVAGTTVADEGVVKLLRRQSLTLQEQRDEAERARRAAQLEVAMWERFGEPIVPDMMRGHLTDVAVVLLVGHGVSDDLLDEVESGIAVASGRIAGRVRFTDKWLLPTPEAQADLAKGLRSTRNGASALTEEAATRLAVRLRSSADPGAEGDLLDALGRAGFLSLDGVGRGSFPPSGAAFVYLSSGVEDPSPPWAGFTLPLFRTMAGTLPVAAAEPLGSATSVADGVRGEGDVRDSVATVDHVDTMPGRLSLVSALRDVIGGKQAPHYGTRRRTSGVAPLP